MKKYTEEDKKELLRIYNLCAAAGDSKIPKSFEYKVKDFTFFKNK